MRHGSPAPPEFEDETLQLTADDLLVIFTDGVSEALSKDGEEYGDDRILACIQEQPDASAADLLKRVFDGVFEFATGAVQHDDITALVVRYRG